MDDAWADLPMLLTVDEAARLLRVGRSHACNQTTLYFETSGIDGIPAIRIGGVSRVPKHALHELVTTGRLSNSQPETTELYDGGRCATVPETVSV